MQADCLISGGRLGQPGEVLCSTGFGYAGEHIPGGLDIVFRAFDGVFNELSKLPKLHCHGGELP